jgi:hypothetical protein
MPNSIEVKLKTRFSLASNDQSDKSLCKQVDDSEKQKETDEQSIRIDVLNAHLDSNSHMETQKKVIEKWNKITTCIVDNKKVIVNRTSWVTKNGKSIKYVYDSMGYPL